jgi:hypothetical protein
MEQTEKTFADLSITELITMEAWLVKEFEGKYQHVGYMGVTSHEDAKSYDNLKAKISDAADAILERVSTIQRNTFGDVANF